MTGSTTLQPYQIVDTRHFKLHHPFQKEHSRGKEHTNWVKMWQEVVLDLEAYVAEYHPYGLVWQKG